MLKLQLFGSLDLMDAGRDVAPVLRRPKTLALLAYLASARPRGFHRRDALLALFWPDLDQAHARNALRQTVHTLRHVLGPEVVTGRGEEELVWIAPSFGATWRNSRSIWTRLTRSPPWFCIAVNSSAGFT